MHIKWTLALILVAFGSSVTSSHASPFEGVPDFKIQPQQQGFLTPPLKIPEQKSDQEYWNGVGLGKSDLKNNLDANLCLSAEKIFIACLRGLTQGLQTLSDALMIVSNQFLKDHPNLGVVKKQVGLFSIVHPTSKVMTSEKEFYEQVAKTRKEMNQDYASAFKQWKEAQAAQKENKKEEAGNKENELKKDEFGSLVDEVFEFIANEAQTNEKFSVSMAVGLSISKAVSMMKDDPHFRFSPKEKWDDYRNGANRKQYFGIGAYVKTRGLKLYLSPMPGSPADLAGVRINDIVTHIDGKDLTEFDPVNGKSTLKANNEKTNQSIPLLKGEAGSIVKVRVQRGDEILELEITRGPVTIENVSQYHKGSLDESVGYLKLGTFDGKTCPDIEAVLDEYVEEGKEKFIIDLRANGGGLISSAQCLVDLFVDLEALGKPKKLVVQQKAVDGSGLVLRSYYVRTAAKYPNAKLVVLINEGSASASEIVSGALQHYKSATIIGTRSYGKGSVQAINRVPANRKLVALSTIARFYIPGGEKGTWTNQLVGIMPDFEVFHKPNPTEEEKFATRMEHQYEAPLGGLGKPFRPEMTDAKKEIQKCMSENGKAAEFWEPTKDLGFPSDYQLNSANDYFNCVK